MDSPVQFSLKCVQLDQLAVLGADSLALLQLLRLPRTGRTRQPQPRRRQIGAWAALQRPCSS